MSSLFVEAVLVSVYANTEALLICCAGAYALYYKVVAPPDLKAFSRLLIKVAFPCLTFSNFQIYSLELLGEWYTASICSALTLALGAALGQLGAFALGLKPPYNKMLVLCTTFGNVGALPYVLVPPIVLSWSRVNDDPDTALQKGFGVISLYAIVWSLALFGIGQPYAMSMRKKEEAAPPATAVGSVQARPSVLRRIYTKLRAIEPVVYASIAGVVVGCITPLRDFLSPQTDGAFRFVGSFSQNLGRAGVPLSTLILGGSLYLGASAQLEKRRKAREACRSLSLASRVSASQETGDVKLSIAAESAKAPPADDAKPGARAAEETTAQESQVAQEQSGGTAVANIVSTTSDAAGVRAASLAAGACCAWSPMSRLTLAALLIKLVLMPLISIPLLLAATRAGLLASDEPMLLMILVIQSGVPSAQTGLALVVAAGLQKEAGEMSIVYLPMYVLSVLTMAVVIVVAVVSLDPILDDATNPMNSTS